MLRPQILLVVVYSFCGMHIFGQANNNYQLTWSDEFNKDGKSDPSNWNFENGFIRNFEDQWY